MVSQAILRGTRESAARDNQKRCLLSYVSSGRSNRRLTLFQSTKMWFLVGLPVSAAHTVGWQTGEYCFGVWIPVWDRGKPKQLSIHGGVNLPKAVTAKSGDPAGEKKREDGAKASRHPEPLNLEQFKDTPVKGSTPILRMRSRDNIAPI